MTTVKIQDAIADFSKLLDEVARGKKVLITRRGKPAAVLSPPPRPTKAEQAKQAIEDLKTYSKRQARTLGDLSPKDLINEGRRQ